MAEEKKECKNNFYPIEGVIYSKPVRKAEGRPGTVNAGKVFEFPSIILEVKRTYKDQTFTELPEFELGKGVSMDNFDIGDSVEITFSLGGKSIKLKGGRDPWHKTSAKALYIKHTDRQYNDTTAVGASFEKKQPKKDDFFMPPPPDAEDNNNEDDTLPF